MAKRMPPDSPPPQRLLAELALMGGGALLITSSVIHLLLWSESYREVDPIGQILVLLGIVGILLALVVVRFGTLGMVLAGALYLALTTAMLLLVSGFGLLGYREGLPAPYTARSIIVPIVGLALLAGVAWLISSPSRKPRPVAPPKSEVVSDSRPTGGGAEPATLIPGTDLRSMERIRWPAQRPPMRVGAEPAAEPPAPPPLEGPAREEPAPKPALVDEIAAEPVPVDEVSPEPTAAPKPVDEPALEAKPVDEPAPEAEATQPALLHEVAPGPEVAEPALVEEVASEPAPVYEATSEPAPVQEIAPEPESAEPALVEVVASEPEAVEQADEELPESATAAVELEAEPTAEPGEDLPPPPEPTEELAAEQEAVPEWIPEPLRSQLVREHEILERLKRALGPDDPGVLTTRSNIAAYYLVAGDVARAAALQEGVAADSTRILGATHPHALTAQKKAAQWRKLAKKRRKPKVPVSR